MNCVDHLARFANRVFRRRDPGYHLAAFDSRVPLMGHVYRDGPRAFRGDEAETETLLQVVSF